MDSSHLLLMFEYNAWANRRLWDCVMGLDEADFGRAFDGGRQTIRQQCQHIYGVEHWWPLYLRTHEVSFLDHSAEATRDEVRAAWDKVEAATRETVAGLTDKQLGEMVSPDIWGGELEIEAWQALMQVLHHSTDHRAQLLGDIRALGGETFEQDVLGFLYERYQAARR